MKRDAKRFAPNSLHIAELDIVLQSNFPEQKKVNMSVFRLTGGDCRSQSLRTDLEADLPPGDKCRMSWWRGKG